MVGGNTYVIFNMMYHNSTTLQKKHLNKNLAITKQNSTLVAGGNGCLLVSSILLLIHQVINMPCPSDDMLILKKNISRVDRIACSVRGTYHALFIVSSSHCCLIASHDRCRSGLGITVLLAEIRTLDLPDT